MKRDDESFVWSFSSFWGSEGQVKDVLMYKYPFAIILERHMKAPNVAWLYRVLSFCFPPLDLSFPVCSLIKTKDLWQHTGPVRYAARWKRSSLRCSVGA